MFEKQHWRTQERIKTRWKYMKVLTKCFPVHSLSFESFFFIHLLRNDATFSSLTKTISVLAIGKFIRWRFNFSVFQSCPNRQRRNLFKLIFLSMYLHSKNCSYKNGAKFSFIESSKIKLFSKANEIRAFLSCDTRQSNKPAHRLTLNGLLFVQFRDIINILLTSFSRDIL